jgi:hypothetical protein
MEYVFVLLHTAVNGPDIAAGVTNGELMITVRVAVATVPAQAPVPFTVAVTV